MVSTKYNCGNNDEAKTRNTSWLLCSRHRFAFDVNLTQIRPSFFIFNYKVKTKLPSRHRMVGAVAFSCAAVHHRCLAGPGVIVQLEFTSSPLEGGDDSLPQPFRERGTKNYIFKKCCHIYAIPNGNSFLAILE